MMKARSTTGVGASIALLIGCTSVAGGPVQPNEIVYAISTGSITQLTTTLVIWTDLESRSQDTLFFSCAELEYFEGRAWRRYPSRCPRGGMWVLRPGGMMSLTDHVRSADDLALRWRGRVRVSRRRNEIEAGRGTLLRAATP
jgi:hypothetical protein